MISSSFPFPFSKESPTRTNDEFVVDDDDVAVAASSFSLLPSPMTFDSNSLVIAVLLVDLLSMDVFTAFGDNIVFVEWDFDSDSDDGDDGDNQQKIKDERQQKRIIQK